MERITAPHRGAGSGRIEKLMPFPTLGFDCANGSEFLDEIVEAYPLRRHRSVEWTRLRAYKKNDQAHAEQKNFTHVRQLLGYEREECGAEHDHFKLIGQANVRRYLPVGNQHRLPPLWEPRSPGR